MTTEEMVDWLVLQYPGSRAELQYSYTREDLGDVEPYAYVCITRGHDGTVYVDKKGNETKNRSRAYELCYWSYDSDLHDVVEYLYNLVKELKDGKK